MAEIINAKTIATRDGCKTAMDWTRKVAKTRGFDIAEGIAESPVVARLDFRRWVADCECGGAEYVSPDEPLFFCQSCGNSGNHGQLRPVVFPERRDEIEAAVRGGLFHSWAPEPKVSAPVEPEEGVENNGL